MKEKRSEMSEIPKIKHLETNSELDNFYNKILDKAKLLISEEKYQEALEIVNEEIEQPYIPIKFYDIFHELKYEIMSVLYNHKIENKYWIKSPSELLKIIINSNVFIIEYWEVFLDKLEIQEEEIDKYFDLINEIFKSNKLENTDKFYILQSLIDLSVNHEFDFKNSYSNLSIKINPSTIIEEMKNSKYTLAIESLYNYFFKDITKFNFSQNILHYVQDYYFPEFPFSSLDSLVKSIINYVDNVMFDENKDNWIENNDDELVYQALKVLAQ